MLVVRELKELRVLKEPLEVKDLRELKVLKEVNH